jgi:hypothetical protein
MKYAKLMQLCGSYVAFKTDVKFQTGDLICEFYCNITFEMAKDTLEKDGYTVILGPQEWKEDRFRVIVTRHYRQMSYCDQCGYKIELEMNTENKSDINEGILELDIITEALRVKIDGRPNGSNPAVGIVWDTKADIEMPSEYTRLVYTNHPIGD